MATPEVPCPSCSKPNRYTASLCAHCGARIAIAGRTSTDDPTETAKAVLGCGAFLALLAFGAWLIFKEPSAADLRQRAEVERQLEREREIEAIRLENTRIACNAGVQTACVEYAEMID